MVLASPTCQALVVFSSPGHTGRSRAWAANAHVKGRRVNSFGFSGRGVGLRHNPATTPGKQPQPQRALGWARPWVWALLWRMGDG